MSGRAKRVHTDWHNGLTCACVLYLWLELLLQLLMLFGLWYLRSCLCTHPRVHVRARLRDQSEVRRRDRTEVTDVVISCQTQRRAHIPACQRTQTHTGTRAHAYGHTPDSHSLSVCALHTPGTLVSLITHSPICSCFKTPSAHNHF